MLVLDDPSQQPFKFKYAAAGFGLGAGLRLPARLRLPEIKLPRFISKDGTIAGVGSTSDFISKGVVYRFKERELEATDFVGLTLCLDAGGGVLVAGGLTLFVTGLTQWMIVGWLFNPVLFTNVLFSTASALVLMAGVSEGLVDGINATPMIGSISYEGPYQK
ncbi:hypothetical protein [Burkholderia sp. 8Y]|uniref:hypothetical protein n=1 Tax=Burkholderia sp. 8Y TaxID=2653133 RepID=UPI00135A08C5|nr:hypothetical protein [Burkholderia sp. 8Y]